MMEVAPKRSSVMTREKGASAGTCATAVCHSSGPSTTRKERASMAAEAIST